MKLFFAGRELRPDQYWRDTGVCSGAEVDVQEVQLLRHFCQSVDMFKAVKFNCADLIRAAITSNPEIVRDTGVTKRVTARLTQRVTVTAREWCAASTSDSEYQ